MIIEKIPFKIDFPIRILQDKRVNFKDKTKREELFKRHIYYHKYEKIKNPLLERREKLFYNLAEELIKFLSKKNPHLNILNISIFGSSLYYKEPRDFDFLVIVKGNIFVYKEARLTIKKNGNKINYNVGISIKGIENFSRGIFNIRSEVSLNIQSQVIYRTVISLFKRHIPIIGYDFTNNEKLFLKNAYAQISDLLNNAYELYYLKNKESKLNNKARARKILSRIYEAISYMVLLEKDSKIKRFRKKIYKQIEKGAILTESKRLFNDMILLYKKKTEKLGKHSRNKKEVLKVLLNDKLKRNIKERLENYWRYANLPYKWVYQILEILSKYYYDEDLAIKEVRKRFPSISNKDRFQKKLEDFRKIKVRNLARRIEKDVFGRLIVDIGGRTDDFVEQIILLNREIEKAYVTDLCSFTNRSKNPKINFIVQSSLTKMPFAEKSMDTIILSMVLHHLKKNQQKEVIRNLVSYLKDRGRIILIEDTYPEKININKYDKITRDFLKFKSHRKKRILYFYDWFGNRLMRNRDNIPLFYNYRTIEEWKKLFEKYGLKQIKSEFIKENKVHPDIFPPKAIMVFQKNQYIIS